MDRAQATSRVHGDRTRRRDDIQTTKDHGNDAAIQQINAHAINARTCARPAALSPRLVITKCEHLTKGGSWNCQSGPVKVTRQKVAWRCFDNALIGMIPKGMPAQRALQQIKLCAGAQIHIGRRSSEHRPDSQWCNQKFAAIGMPHLSAIKCSDERAHHPHIHETHQARGLVQVELQAIKVTRSDETSVAELLEENVLCVGLWEVVDHHTEAARGLLPRRAYLYGIL
mmetsp:Transcript_106990/g.268182  ORF Transcript_106990/g.268182 Transcript_106990/m.268182 type:complete len:227 (-) Transcript_106990:641-1321(-)